MIWHQKYNQIKDVMEVKIMHIDHIALYVNNLEKEKEFFEIYFGAKAGDKYVHEEIGFSSYQWSTYNR